MQEHISRYVLKQQYLTKKVCIDDNNKINIKMLEGWSRPIKICSVLNPNCKDEVPKLDLTSSLMPR